MSTRFLSLTLGAMALSAVALTAPMAAWAQGAAGEMQRAHGNPSAMPTLPGQDRIAHEADQADINDIHGFLTSARAAVARRQFGQAGAPAGARQRLVFPGPGGAAAAPGLVGRERGERGDGQRGER